MRRILRPRVLIGTLLGLVTLYTLLGFLLLPYLITSYVVPAAAEQIKHPIVLREAAFNPFTLALRLTGLEVREENQRPILGFEEFLVNVSATTLFFQTIAIDEIRLVMPFVAARVGPQGTLNLAQLIPPADEPTPPPTQPKKMMPLEIERLEITQGILGYRDESKPQPVVLDIVPVEVVLRDFSTVQHEGENAYSFTAEIGKGETVAWEGTILLDPVESDGKVTLSGLKLGTFYQAVQDQFRFDLRQGTVDVSATYHVDLRGQAPQVTIKNGNMSVQDLAIAERGGFEPVISIPTFNLEGIELDLQKQAIDIAKVQSSKARFDAWLNREGVLNYQPLFTPVADAQSEGKPSSEVTKSETPAKPWTITINEIGLNNYRASFEDRTLTRPAHVDVEAMNLTVKDVHIPFKKPLPVDLSMKVNKTGSILLNGKVGVEPLSIETDLTLAHIEIRPFQPYLDRFLAADVRDGVIELAGAMRFAKEHVNEPLLRFQGNVAINRLAIIDPKDFDDVATWKALSVNQLALEVEPTSVKISEIVWQEPSVEIVMEADGRLNLARLAASPPPDEQPEKKKAEGESQAAAPSEPVSVVIDQVKVGKLAATFEDLSINPRVKTSLTQFGGTIKGLSSKQLKKADVDLTGKVGRSAPLKIVGKINPLSENAFTDLVITLGGMDLVPSSPYSGKYVGYGVSKGKLSLDLKYKVSQKVLEAENFVRVDQLTFGEETKSPDATSLPVPLVVGLLKDRKGTIEIDMPIRGDLTDPDFKYGKVVISTLLNLLTRVVASPFSLMGKLIPGGDGANGDDLQFIEFQPGSIEVSDSEKKKLEALKQALDERAGLRLDITGTSDSTLDRAALQTAKLREQLFAMRGGAGKKSNDEPEPLSPKDEQRLVEKLYAKVPMPDSGVDPSATQPTVAEMRQRVADAIPISEDELEALARQRAEAVRNQLLTDGKLTEDRVVVHDVGAAESGHEKVRTQLALSAGS